MFRAIRIYNVRPNFNISGTFRAAPRITPRMPRSEYHGHRMIAKQFSAAFTSRALNFIDDPDAMEHDEQIKSYINSSIKHGIASKILEDCAFGRIVEFDKFTKEIFDLIDDFRARELEDEAVYQKYDKARKRYDRTQVQADAEKRKNDCKESILT